MGVIPQLKSAIPLLRPALFSSSHSTRNHPTHCVCASAPTRVHTGEATRTCTKSRCTLAMFVTNSPMGSPPQNQWRVPALSLDPTGLTKVLVCMPHKPFTHGHAWQGPPNEKRERVKRSFVTTSAKILDTKSNQGLAVSKRAGASRVACPGLGREMVPVSWRTLVLNASWSCQS